MIDKTSVQYLRFQHIIKKWNEETRFLSSTIRIMENENFIEILSMGESVVPFIVDELKKEPSCLVWALNVIYRRKISNEQISLKKASKLWVDYLENII